MRGGPNLTPYIIYLEVYLSLSLCIYIYIYEGGLNLTPYGRRLIYIHIYIYTINNTAHKLTRLQSLLAHQTLELFCHLCIVGASAPCWSRFCTTWHVVLEFVHVLPSSRHKLHNQRLVATKGATIVHRMRGHFPNLALEGWSGLGRQTGHHLGHGLGHHPGRTAQSELDMAITGQC